MRTAARGETTLAPQVAAWVLDQVRGADPTALTRRQVEVLQLVAAGRRNHEIAQRLFISDATAKTHVRHVLEKLRFRNRAEAAAFAARHMP